MHRWGTGCFFLALAWLLVSGFTGSGVARAQTASPSSEVGAEDGKPIGRFVDLYCVECHNSEDKTAGLALDDARLGGHRAGTRRPGRRSSGSSSRGRCRRRTRSGRRGAAYDSIVSTLAASLDRAAAEQPESRPDRHVPAAQPDRVPERHPRPAGARHRRRGAAADRRVQPRLRQRDGGRPLADAPGPLHHRGAEDQPAGGRQPGPLARRRHVPDPAGPHAGGARRGAAARHARRRADPVHVPAGRRVRDPGPADARPQRARRGPARAARAGGAAGSRADGVVHRDAAARADEDHQTGRRAPEGPHPR